MARFGKRILIHTAVAEGQIATVKGLFLEYAETLGVDLCFQDFERELTGLPGAYAAPTGGLFLAESEGKPAGCVAFRQNADGVCEMKRLYVRPEFRGLGLGIRLAERSMAEARKQGYVKMRLDTLDSMSAAIALYRSLGFRPIEAYYDNPIPGALYFEARLWEKVEKRERPCDPVKMMREDVALLVTRLEERYGDLLTPWATSEAEVSGTGFRIRDIPVTFSVVCEDELEVFDVQIESDPPGDYLYTTEIGLQDLLNLVERYSRPVADWPQDE